MINETQTQNHQALTWYPTSTSFYSTAAVRHNIRLWCALIDRPLIRHAPRRGALAASTAANVNGNYGQEELRLRLRYIAQHTLSGILYVLCTRVVACGLSRRSRLLLL